MEDNTGRNTLFVKIQTYFNHIWLFLHGFCKFIFYNRGSIKKSELYKKKIALVTSLALGSLLLLGQIVSAEKHVNDERERHDMMEAMQAPHGQKIMKACNKMLD